MTSKDDEHIQMDLYEILGVNRNATQDEIKKNYNELVLLYHPDKGGDAKKFKDLQVAYKVLSNEKNREIYTKSLSSTYEDIITEYRDTTTGVHKSLGYDVSGEDFTKGTTEEEKVLKKDSFMNKFDEIRSQQEKELLSAMSQGLDDKTKKNPAKVPTYQDLLKQNEEELTAPIIEGLMAREDGESKWTFNNDLFNQVFEHNKQTQSHDMEPYSDIREFHRTDLAPVGDDSMFATDQDADQPNCDFFTYKYDSHVDMKQFNPSQNVSRTREMVFDDVQSLIKKRTADRELFDKSIKVNPPPTTVEDKNPLSYQSMGINFAENK